jgi:sec-independent protein translocase protein TatA
MFDIGLQELVLIFVIALLVFGPKNLPQLGRSLGRAMREFRRASDEFRSTIETNLEMNAPDPPPATVETPAAAPAGDGVALAEPALVEAAVATEPSGAEEPEPGEPYLAQRGARLFHRRDCGWARRIPEAERVYFKRIPDARDAGHVNCPSCDPWEPS